MCSCSCVDAKSGAHSLAADARGNLGTVSKTRCLLGVELSSYVLGSFVAHVGALVAIASSFPLLGPDVEEDATAEQTYLVPAVFAEGAPEADPPADGSTTAWHEKLGDPSVLSGAGRFGVAGPADNPDPHVSRFHPGPDMYWILGWGPPAHMIGSLAPRAPWGRDDALGTDPISDRGKVWGEDIGESPGKNGPGSHAATFDDAKSSYGYRCRMP